MQNTYKYKYTNTSIHKHTANSYYPAEPAAIGVTLHVMSRTRNKYVTHTDTMQNLKVAFERQSLYQVGLLGN